MPRARKRTAYIAIEEKVQKKDEQKTEGSEQASAGKDCNTRGPSETEGSTSGGSDLQFEHPGCKREKSVWTCLLRVGEGSVTWL